MSVSVLLIVLVLLQDSLTMRTTMANLDKSMGRGMRAPDGMSLFPFSFFSFSHVAYFHRLSVCVCSFVLCYCCCCCTGTVVQPMNGVRIGGAGFFAPDGNTSRGRFAFRKSKPQEGDAVVVPPSGRTMRPDSKATDPVGVLVGQMVLPDLPPEDPSKPKSKPGLIKPKVLLPHRADWVDAEEAPAPIRDVEAMAQAQAAAAEDTSGPADVDVA